MFALKRNVIFDSLIVIVLLLGSGLASFAGEAWPGHDASVYKSFSLPKGKMFWLHGIPSKVFECDGATGKSREKNHFKDYEGVIDIVCDGKGKYYLGPHYDEFQMVEQDDACYFFQKNSTIPGEVSLIVFKVGDKCLYLFRTGSFLTRIYYGEVWVKSISDIKDPWKSK